MTDDLYDSDSFEIEYPIWTLHDPSKAQPGRVWFRRLVEPDHGDVFPVFTDLDLATRFLELSKLPDCAPLPIKNTAQAIQVGEYWLQRGVRYVGLDLSIIPTGDGQHRKAGSFLDLAGFVEELRGGPKS